MLEKQHRNANARLQVDLSFDNHSRQADADLMRELSDLNEPFNFLPLDRGVARGSEWQQPDICRRVEVTKFAGFQGAGGVSSLGPSGNVRFQEATGPRVRQDIVHAPTTLFMSGRSNGIFLYTVDKSTSVADRFGGAVMFGSEAQLGFATGMAFNPNTDTFYVCGTGPASIIEVDRTTGAGVRRLGGGALTDFGVGESAPRGIAYDPNQDILYMVGVVTAALYTINREEGRANRVGLATDFDALEQQPYGLAFDTTRQTLFMLSINPNNRLYRLNTVTGAARQVSNVQTFGSRGMTYDAETDQLFYLGSNDIMYTVDRDTVASTRVGTATEFGIGESSPGSLAAVVRPDPDPPIPYLVGRATDALYTLNLDTAHAAQVGSAVQFDESIGDPQGLTTDRESGTLWLVGNVRLWTLSRMTGVATRVGLLTNFGLGGATINARGVAYVPSEGVLYMVAIVNTTATPPVNQGFLYRLAPSNGAATLIGDVVNFGAADEPVPQGLAYDDETDTLYMTGSTRDRLFAVDRETAVATAVGPSGYGLGAIAPIGLSIHPVTRELYMIDITFDQFVIVDKDTGIGVLGPRTVANFGVGETEPTGLAFY